MSEENFPFICADTEDDSKELGEACRKGVKGASMFNKRVTQIAAIHANGARWYSPKGDVKAFKEYLLFQARNCGVKYVYFLNQQYDLGNLFSRSLDDLDCLLVGGRMIKAQWGPITFVDVYNLWQMSVANLGKVFGLAKLEFDSKGKEYVFRDVEIIREAMLYVWKFAAELGINDVPPTLGSLGVKLWKHWGGETVHESRLICRDSIFGGRVELFKTCNDSFYEMFAGDHNAKFDANALPDNIAYTDVNSMYPWAMTQKFPGMLEDTGKEMKEFGVAQVTMQVPKCEIAPLPFRNDEGKIYYPYGKFTGVWTLAEIRNAEKHGAKILKVHDVLSTDESFFPYREYMERIYKIRKSSTNQVEKSFYKLLMNTLFGRTGSSGKISRTVFQNEHNRFDGVPYGSRVLVNYNMPLGEEVNWAHTAHITSYGRLRLQEFIRKIGAERMIYCDTDSTIFDCPDKKLPFAVGDGLGEMKLEGWERLAITYAPKMYRLGDKFKAKGVPKKLQQEYIEKGKAVYDMPFKFREAVAFYDRGNVKQLSVWREIEKKNNANYDKKIRKKNRFFPLRINAE